MTRYEWDWGCSNGVIKVLEGEKDGRPHKTRDLEVSGRIRRVGHLTKSKGALTRPSWVGEEGREGRGD